MNAATGAVTKSHQIDGWEGFPLVRWCEEALGIPLHRPEPFDALAADLAPFALGKPLPAFSLTGEGTLDADVGFTAAHLAGRLDATADRLGVLRRELAVLGPLTLSATFDLESHRSTD